MSSGIRWSSGIAVIIMVGLGPGARMSAAQQLRVENFYPHHAPAGQTTLVTLAVTSRDPVQGADITPAQGVTVVEARRAGGVQGNVSWAEVTLEVAKDAAPGDRTMVLLLPSGRTTPVTITIPTHAPRIADLRAAPGAANPATVEIQLSAIDASADLGGRPYVWFTIGCTGDPLRGVVRGRADAPAQGQTVVRASLPRPATPGGACDLQVRVTDDGGTDSNTLRVEVAPGASAPSSRPETAPASSVAAGGEWVEFVSQEERFTALFPGTPTMTDTAWFSQFGAVLPARVYSVTQGESRFVITVVDYRPVERVQVEKARACPDGANTCQGIPDWGIGYWKNDIRGAIVYAVSKFLTRNVTVTELIWNGIALVQGQALQLTNNADQSRTFVGVYMHDNRLVIVDATVAPAYPAPVAFTESIGWIDERGRAVRYQTMYVNMPDVPKPAPR